MKYFIGFFLVFILAFGCNAPTNSIEENIKSDVKTLVELEQKIVDIAVKIYDTNDSTLVAKQDSLTRKLHEMSQTLQEKYTKDGHLEKFQEVFKNAKKK